MAWADTEIEITGEVRDEADLEKLVTAIVADRPTPGWSDAPIKSEADATQWLRDVLSAGQKLVFAENERVNESFPRIEAACREIGLGYIRTVSVDEEFDTPGSRDIYTPSTQELEELSGMANGYISAAAVLSLLEAEKISEAIESLKHAIAPAAGLPKNFSIADGLLPGLAPRI